MRLMLEWISGNGELMKSLQEKLDESAKALEPILWELLDEIEESKWKNFI